MKILHTADWHIGQFKGPVVDGVNLRSQDTVKCLEYMVQVAIEEKPDIVCVSGDIFHQEQVGPVRYSDEMITATNIITSLAHFSKYVIVMRGTPNHDGAAQFRVLERMLLNIRNVDVVTEPGVIKTPWADIACLPGFDKQEFRAKFPGLSADEENLAWTKYISDMVFALRAECEKTPILMAHYTVPGCNMESGQTSFFTNFEPVIPREALMAARYEAVLLGHIHRPQIIEGLDNVFYSGAINAMNFNDEGQDRGFWIHEFNEKGTLVKGHKCTTPYRQFYTITWDPDEAGDYIREGAMYLHRTGISEDVTDKIVRVRYSCTSEQKKALNIPLLQKNLYELGAFYVADIEAESTIDITNRGLLSEESDPRLNLKKWLEEKTFKNPDKIVELAEPIIAEAMKQSTTAEIHGVFKPVSISVRNYRNYKEESFDFSDISFCTINGVNGAGKSSLFMDAIVDCLFEETREGDCKAWIRGTEDEELKGYQVAAYIAGVVAATPANQSVTHATLSRYSVLNEILTNTEMEVAEEKGCLVLSTASDGAVWLDNGVNTLVHPDANHDSGWKKIRRTKTRYELLNRANAAADALVGKVDNDTNGRATIMAAIQGICNAMEAEGKIQYGNVTESTTVTTDGDTCGFDIEVIDLDSAEHIYLNYYFQFSTIVAASGE